MFVKIYCKAWRSNKDYETVRNVVGPTGAQVIMAAVRCRKCENCQELERVRKRVLACANPPFSHIVQDVIDLWNRELERLPCTAPELSCDGTCEPMCTWCNRQADIAAETE